MNKARRDRLREAMSYLDMASAIVTDIKYCEQDNLDNTPDNLQMSFAYEKREDCISNLEDACDGISSAIDRINDAMV